MTTVLVVDDEPDVLAVVVAILEEEGYQIAAARNGQEALEQLRQARADLVLSDVMMPLLDGRELCRTMAADPNLGTIPVIMMSAGGEARVRDACPHRAFVAKPFNLDVLLATVQWVLAGAREQHGARMTAADRRP